MKTPRGFAYAGINCGIKAARKDLALVFSEVPCAAAGCFTVNAVRAAPVVDAAARLPAEGMRAIVANSGNANALAGPESVNDARAVCAAVADALGVGAETVLGASTGVIGVRLPVAKLAAAAPRLAAARGAAIESAAEAVWTTDTRVKLASRTMRVGDVEATFAALAKGAGMVAPELATVLAFITTDLRVSARTLQAALSRAVQTSFEMVTVDGDMSTNDAVFALANGLAANPPVVEDTPEYDALVETLEALGLDLARQIAEDGDGATKLVEVRDLRRARGEHGARAREGRGRVDAGQGGDLRGGSELGSGAGGASARASVRDAGRSTRRTRRCTYRARASTSTGRRPGRTRWLYARRCATPSCSSRCGWPRATRGRPRGDAISATTS